MLHIEITGESSDREWEALAALVAVMRGQPGCTVNTGAPSPIMPEVVTAERRTMAEAVAAGLLDPAAPIAAQQEQVAAAVAAGAVLDADGLPWDARIHASTKTQTQDGRWKAARKIDPALKAAVEAELRAVMAATPATPAAAAVVPPPPPTEDGPAVTDPAAAFPAAEVPAPPANSFAELMKKVVAKQAAGTLSTEATTAVAQSLGLTGIADLAKRPDLIPSFEALLP